MPYAGSLVLTILIAAYANYVLALLYPPNITIKGQVPAIVIPFIGFPITFVLWLFYKGKPSASKLLQTLFFGLMVVWVVHFLIIHIHHDMYVHTLWLFVPSLLLLALKTPSAVESWKLIRLLAWTAATIIVMTRILEICGLLPQWFIPDAELAQWERDHYWLPFANHLGVASRWPGPYNGNARTGFVAVFLVVVALAKWRRSNVVLLLVGVFTMVLTGGRGVYLSALAGLLILFAFSRARWLRKLSIVARFGILAVPVLALLAKFLLSPASSTGRLDSGGIWDSFLSLWHTNVWLGVGHIGILTSGTVNPAMDAHSIFVQELVEFGLVGFSIQFATLGIASLLTISAAVKGRPEGFAILSCYILAASTELLNDGWLSHSMYTLIVLLSAMTSIHKPLHQERGSSSFSSVEANEPHSSLSGTELND